VIGGAAINRDFGRRIAFLDDERALLRSGRLLREGCLRRARDHGRADVGARTREAFVDAMLAEARARASGTRGDAARPVRAHARANI
jgi:hypothetical protein